MQPDTIDGLIKYHEDAYDHFKKQGAKSAGLFAQRRPGAKAGY